MKYSLDFHEIESLIIFETGIYLLIICPFFVLFSQIGLAIREIALNSRKTDHPFSDTSYSILFWLCYSVTIISTCGFVLGIIATIKYFI